MKEDFLKFVWQQSIFNTSALQSTNGESIEIINKGFPNDDSGPDFLNAKVKIGEQLWAGNVELHVNSSLWEVHNHQNDKAYNNVILHVVFEDDKPIKNQKGNLIPTLELKGLIPKYVYQNYLELLESKLWIPCENLMQEDDFKNIKLWYESLLIERIEGKSKTIEKRLIETKFNWEQIFFEEMAKCFGLKQNILPFELVAKSIDFNQLLTHADQLTQLEAILFGQAGFLNDKINDGYYQSLQKEYQFLKQKFNLNPIDSSIWKFLRLRPANFPTVRLAQLASLIYTHKRIFATILNANQLKDIYKIFNVSTSEYWKTHYHFSKNSTQKSKSIGKSKINIIIINAITPLLFLYSKHKNEEHIAEKVLNWLNKMKPETNSIVSKWKSLNLPIENAVDSQALLQLKNNYCNFKRCLDCRIGKNILYKNGR